MRIFLATFFGIIASVGVNMSVLMIGQYIRPMGDGLANSDPQAIAEMIKSFTFVDFLIPLSAHILGISAGLLIARAICSFSLIPIFIVAGLHMLGTVMNLFMIPAPIWFILVDVIVPILITLPFILKVKRA